MATKQVTEYLSEIGRRGGKIGGRARTAKGLAVMDAEKAAGVRKRALDARRRNSAGKLPDGWTPRDEAALKRYVEELFAERTPPLRPEEVLPETRVTRSEIRGFAMRRLRKLPPEADESWARNFARWYVSMARRIEKRDDR